MILKSAIDALTSVFAPAPCRICGHILLNASRIPVCETCLNSFERITEPMCQRCGRPFVSEVALQAITPQCRLCRADFYSFDSARSFAIYGETLSQAITLLKYEEISRLGVWFGERLAEIASSLLSEQWRPDAVVPVPLHEERRRERGYNQAELVARQTAKLLRLSLRVDLLVRIRPRPPQLLLSRSERWKCVRGAYGTRKGRRVDKLNILLIDDVMTTGATLDACAQTLKKAGAGSVMGLTVARMIPDWAVRQTATSKKETSGHAPASDKLG
jgi:competence protein ComFC